MRAFVLLAIGLFLGAAFAFVLSRGLAQREAYPRGMMNVMQHHLAELKRFERAGRCGEADLRPHLERIAALAQDAGEALGAQAQRDPHLADYAAGLVRASAPGAVADCPALARRTAALAEACDACHRDYR